jgi:hypothetical protein
MTDLGPDPRGNATLPDAELDALFARRRPDAERFRAGVAARLAARQDAARQATAARAPGGWRRAASVLPWLPSAHGVLGVLSLPVLLLAGSLATFVHSATALRRTFAAPDPLHPRPHRGRAAWFLLLPTLGIVAAPFVPGVAFLDAVLATVVVSMLALVGVVRAGVRADTVWRDGMAQIADWMLIVLLPTSVGLALISTLHGSTARWNAACMPIVLVGLAVTAWHRTRLPRVVGLTLVAALSVWVGGATWQRLTRPVTAAMVQELLAAANPSLDDLIAWRGLGAAAEALRTLGLTPTLHPELGNAFATALAGGVDLHPQVLTAAERLGIATPAQWHALAADVVHRPDRLISLPGPLRLPSYAAYRLPLWLATGGPSPAERDRLLANIEATWPNDTTAMPLAAAALCLRWLGDLDRLDLADAHRDDVLRRLATHQVPAGLRDRGGFREFLHIPGANAEATHHAIALLRHFGAPATVDRVALHEHVDLGVRHLQTIGRSVSGDALLQAADLLLLRRDLPIDLPWWHWLVRERLVIGFALVVLLCLWVVWLAPPRPGHAVGDTLP